ncbi:MAG: TonB-dependent receptor [Candidatus Electrothrix communis]|nr:MAG: TonB-dependent receptor [Candidatus Electrothrix communis]
MYKTTAAVALLLLLNCTQGRAEAENENFTTSEEDIQKFEEMFGQGPQEEDVYRTDRLLLTATGSLKPVHLAPSVASVITAEDIEKLGATTLDEVLETVPGLHVTPSYVHLDPIYSIRGIHTSLNPQVLLLMNGIPFTKPYNGTRPSGFRLPVSMISRIEVVRGPGSALYGADAFAGTINIITKDRFEVEGMHTGMRLASVDGMDVWGQHGGEYKGWDVAIGIEYWRGGSDNKRIINADLQTKLDQIFGTDASLAPGPLHTDFENYNLMANFSRKNWTVRLWGWFLNDYQGGTGSAGALGPETKVNADQILSDIIWHDDELINDVDLTVQLSYLYRKDDVLYQLLPSGSAVALGMDGNIFTSPTIGVTTFTDGVFGEPILTDQQLTFDLITKYEGWNQHSWRIGIGGKVQDENTEEYKNFGPGVLGDSGIANSTDGTLVEVTDTEGIFMSDQNRTVLYTSLQDEWNFAKSWELTAGVRYDHYSDFGETVNPRIALVWETRYDLTSKLMYGHAFRPPSFAESYIKNNPIFLGNSDLEPETIDTYELAFDYRPAHSLRAVLGVFAYEIEGLIDYVADPSPATTNTAQNRLNQKGHGFEIELEWEATPSLKLSSNFAFQCSKNKDTDAVVADAPGIQFYLNGSWNFMPDWYLNAQYFWIGDRQRAEDDLRKEIKDNSITNMTLRRKNITQHVDLTFSVRNIFNEDIREPTTSDIPNDIPMVSRAIYTELIYHF